MVEDITFDPSNGRIIVDDIVINVEVEDFSGGEHSYAGEFKEDRPAKGVSAWHNDGVNAVVDFSYHERE